MVERLVVGSRAPLFQLSNGSNSQSLKLDERITDHHRFVLLYFYPQSNNVQALEQFYNEHIESSLLNHARIWAILIEDSDDPILIEHDTHTVQDEKKDNAYQFGMVIDRDAQVAWNYNVYDRDTKQGREAVFLITTESQATSESTAPVIIHMQIVDETKGKTAIDWKQVENAIANLLSNGKIGLKIDDSVQKKNARSTGHPRKK